MKIVQIITLSTCLAAASAAPAAAGMLNDTECQVDPERPYPVVLVHGHDTVIEDLATVTDQLLRRGYCVFGGNYGQTGGLGPYGRDHLSASAAQIDGFIEYVLLITGAERVDVVAYATGASVIDNLVLARNAGFKIHRVVSIAGLHHAYATIDAGEALEANLFLPNLLQRKRAFHEDASDAELIRTIIATYGGFEGEVAGFDSDAADSNVAADVFSTAYWEQLQGRLSEPFGRSATFGGSRRSLATVDSAAIVSYVNLVGVADSVAPPAAGFQDDAPNVDNVLVPTSARGLELVDDAAVLDQLLLAIAGADPVGPVDPDDPGDAPPDGGSDDPGDGDDPITGDDGPVVASYCSAGTDPAGALLPLGLVVAALLRRRRLTPAPCGSRRSR